MPSSSGSEQFVDIYFGDLRPDLGGAPNPEMPGYLVDAVGVRLTPNGYRGMPVFADMASAAAIGGATSFWIPAYFEDTASARRCFFALNQADAKIYESQDEGQTWADVTPAAGTAVDVPGVFFTFETDVIYVCYTRAPISRTLSVAVGTDFANLGGSPPIARCGAQVRQHVVLGGLVGVDEYAVQTSAIGNDADWPTPGSADAISKESIRETLPQALGNVRAVLGGEKIGIVMQNYGITRMTYEGGDTVYSFDTFETKVGYGSGARNSTPVSDGKGVWYWYNDNGFYATDGYSVNRLDNAKIEDAVFNNLLSYDSSKTALPIDDCLSAYDPHRHLVIFGNHQSNYQLTYAPAVGSFSFMNETTVSGVFVGLSTTSSSGKTYGPTVFNINDSSRKLQMLSANGAAVTMQTGYIELSPGRRVQLQAAYLIGAGVGSNYTLDYKAAATYQAIDLSSSGFSTLASSNRGMKQTGRGDAPFFAFKVTGTGSEAHLLRGVRVFFTDAGPSI